MENIFDKDSPYKQVSTVIMNWNSITLIISTLVIKNEGKVTKIALIQKVKHKI